MPAQLLPVFRSLVFLVDNIGEYQRGEYVFISSYMFKRFGRMAGRALDFIMSVTMVWFGMTGAAR